MKKKTNPSFFDVVCPAHRHRRAGKIGLAATGWVETNADVGDAPAVLPVDLVDLFLAKRQTFFAILVGLVLVVGHLSRIWSTQALPDHYWIEVSPAHVVDYGLHFFLVRPGLVGRIVDLLDGHLPDGRLERGRPLGSVGTPAAQGVLFLHTGKAHVAQAVKVQGQVRHLLLRVLQGLQNTPGIISRDQRHHAGGLAHHGHQHPEEHPRLGETGLVYDGEVELFSADRLRSPTKKKTRTRLLKKNEA